jgi:capsular polysaccharide biosynthesis protein
VTPPQYAAISYVVVSPAGRSESAAALGYAQAYGKIATDPVILAEAESNAKLGRGTLREGVQASTSPDAPMVQITATSSRPGQAAKNADAVAKALAGTARESVKRTGARLTVLSEAVAPATPVSPSAAIAVSVGACAGGLIGGLVLLTRPQWSRRTAAANGAAPGLAPAGHAGTGTDPVVGAEERTEPTR